MGYLIILALIIGVCLILKIKSDYLFISAGGLLILHPLFLAKNQATSAYSLSIFVFLIFLAALIIRALKYIWPLEIDEGDSLFVNFLKKNLRIKITSVRFGNTYLKKNYVTILLIIIFIFLIWAVSITAAALGVLFLAFAVNKWDSRIMAGFSLVCLFICPFLLIFKNGPLAENMAIFAYYFLVLTVILQIIEYKRGNKPVEGQMKPPEDI